MLQSVEQKQQKEKVLRKVLLEQDIASIQLTTPEREHDKQ